MPRAGFYNDNEYRAYPFIYKKEVPTPSLPDACIVDCGIIMGLDSQYNETEHVVYLHKIKRHAAGFEFHIKTTAPGAENYPLVFNRAGDATEWETEHVLSAPSNEQQCATEPVWEGFVVTGVFDELTETMAVDEERIFNNTDYVLEPARIQSLIKSYLRSISLGNYSRIVAHMPPECGGPENAPERYVVVNKRCMQGELKFKEGHNCEITQIDRNNEIIIGAAFGAGEDGDNICTEIPLFPEEIPPMLAVVATTDRGPATSWPPAADPTPGDAYLLNDTENVPEELTPAVGDYVAWNNYQWINVGNVLPGTINQSSKLLSGGPACDEIMFTVNGLNYEGTVQLIGGTGIVIKQDPDNENGLLIRREDNVLVTGC